jgi:hypothetical protein
VGGGTRGSVTCAADRSSRQVSHDRAMRGTIGSVSTTTIIIA